MPTSRQRAGGATAKALTAAAVLAAALSVSACGSTPATTAAATSPATVEKVPGADTSRLRLTDKAVARLGIQTAAVSERAGRKLMPYSALIYDPRGETWTYTSPEPMVFIRHRVRVERIDGENAVLTEGPPAGTQVATVGAALLFGTEFKVGK